MNTLLIACLSLVAIFSLILFVPPVRRNLLSRPLMLFMNQANLLPTISPTERMILQAGQVGPEREFFLGKPDFESLMKIDTSTLTDEENFFINHTNGPVERLCQMTLDYQVWEEGDFPPHIWNFLKQYKFFGLIIPKEYGGLGFSHLAHSRVIAKLSSRSAPLAVTAMVPNSLGPAELLMMYGTEEQKEFYLPRLADGREIPCFALTEPEAGSDATAITSSGILFLDSETKRIKIRLNWKKRWITLGAVATVIGVAFRLYDPDGLLEGAEDLGITCALVPSSKSGVDQGKRHDPLFTPFINSPLIGKDVVIDIDDIIGGARYAGKGWPMIAEALATGRGISLPSHSTGGAKSICAFTTMHSHMRYQFGLPIGRFEGVQEALAKIYSYTYLMDALSRQVISFLDHYGALPVVSAMAKYHHTEMARVIINSAMDIMGGTGITRGPKNALAGHYISSPIGITVEGANILTRTLIIFGQGAMRSHPYSYDMLTAVGERSLKKFDASFWGLIFHTIKTSLKNFFFFFTRAYGTQSSMPYPCRRYFQKLSWASSHFATLSNLAMMGHGGRLKRMESLSGKFADLLSWQMIGFATLKQFDRSGNQNRALFDYSMQVIFHQIQISLEGIYRNLNFPLLGWWFNGLGLKFLQLAPVGTVPSDQSMQQAVNSVWQSIENQKKLQKGIFVPNQENDPQSIIFRAYKYHQASLPIREKFKKGVAKIQAPSGMDAFLLFKMALDQGILNKEEYEMIYQAEQMRLSALEVDSYPVQTLNENTLGPFRNVA